jgi:hypothetical protein
MSDGWFNGCITAVTNAKAVAEQVYTSTAFNSSRSTTAGSTAAAHVLSVGAGNIATFVRICVTGLSYVDDGNDTNSVYLKIETAESGGAYTERFSQTLLSVSVGVLQQVSTVEFYYVPTAGEIANGLDVRLTSTSTIGGGGGGDAQFTNIQTVIWSN